MTEEEAVRRDIDRHDREIRDLWEAKASKADLDAQKNDLRDYKTSVSEEVSSLRRVIMAFSLTIAASAIGIAFAVLQAGAN